MQCLKGTQELQHLKEVLKTHLPESLKIYGSLFCILSGNPFGVEVLVDSWPDFGVVLTRPLRTPYAWDPFINSYSFFLRDESGTSAVLEHLDWTRAFEVQSMQGFLGSVLETEAAQRGVTVETSLLRTYYQEIWDEDEGRNQKYQETSEISGVSPEHAPLVDRTWSFGSSTSSLNYVSLCLSSLPSSCVLDSDGIPVSWVLCDHYSAMRMLYTVPQHRRKGLGMKVSTKLAQALRMQQRPVYCHVEEQNIPSQLMFKSLGLQETTSRLLWVRYDPIR
ncbi:glycine N-acyltransferase-like [Pelodytes ibericus]